MIDKLKRNKICRKYEEDIWGEITSKGKTNNLTQYMYNLLAERVGQRSDSVFRVDIVKPNKRRKRLSLYGELLNQRRKLCLFYGGLRRKVLRDVAKKGRSRGIVSDYVIEDLESRLCVLVYRMNFAVSMLEARQRVRAGMIMVDREVINLPNTKVKVGSIVEITPMYKDKLYRELYNRVERGEFWTSLPKYLEVNYSIMCGIKVDKVRWGDVAYPFKIEERMFINEAYGR